MLTRCPDCSTSFRVTPDQLKARAGKVRCGKCQRVFNALDSLVETTEATEVKQPPSPQAKPPHPHNDGAAGNPSAAVASLPARAPAPSEVDILLEPHAAVISTASGKAPREPEPPEPDTTNAAPQAGEVAATPPTVEAARDHAVAAGLIAARETTEIPGYNKWAEGAFTSPQSVAIPAERPRGPFVAASLLLLIALAAQAAHHFRSDLAVAVPGIRPWLQAACNRLDCDIPLPRNRTMVSIEASNLQIDPAQGGVLMLTATLMNRAHYAQAWPLFELTLTDVQDNAILRRVLQPSEYLPAKADPTLFPPNSEADVRLWLEAKDVSAAGYRVEILYP